MFVSPIFFHYSFIASIHQKRPLQLFVSRYVTLGSFQRHFRPEGMALYNRSDDTLPP